MMSRPLHPVPGDGQVVVSVRSQVTDRLGDGIPAAANPSLRRGQLGDQRTPAREEESPLLRQRDVSLAASPDPEVLAQLIECRAEAPRCLETPEPEHRVVGGQN